MDNRKFSLGLFLLLLLAFVLRSYGFSSQPPSADDLSAGLSAIRYMEGGQLGPTMWNHPVLRNILVYLSLQLLGGGIWGLKIVSLVLGTLSVPLLGAAARRILKDDGAALMAAFFLAVDPLHIDYSRQAVQEVYMPFFILSGILLSMKYMQKMKQTDRTSPLLLILSGVSFGLGLASKWYVAFPLLITCACLSYNAVRDSGDSSGKISKLIFHFSALIVLPLTIYLLTFAPWFARGYDLSEWAYLQKAMSLETATHTGYNPFTLELDHRASLWFIKPVAFADFILDGSRPVVLLGMSNPLVWLLTIPSTIFVLYRGIRERIADHLYLAALFWLTYIPFLLAHRPIWAHSAFSVIPFSFMAVSTSLVSLLKGKRFGRLSLLLYLISVVIIGAPLYLLATGKGLEIGWLRPLVERFRPGFER